jgi:hypothetical protein
MYALSSDFKHEKIIWNFLFEKFTNKSLVFFQLHLKFGLLRSVLYPLRMVPANYSTPKGLENYRMKPLVFLK